MIALEVRFERKGRGFDAVKIPMAIARGLNEGGDLVRTRVQKALWKQTNVKKYSSITSRMRTVRAYGSSAPKSGIGPVGSGSLAYQIIATGKGIPIKEFPVKLTRKGVDAQSWGVDHLFKRSFGLAGKDADGFRARLGSKRFPIRKLYGPALTKELGKDASAEAFYAGARTLIIPAILKHLGKAL